MDKIIIPKNLEVKLSQNFSSLEFDCKCNGLCNLTEVSKELIIALQAIRDSLNEPIHITSGYRCKTHNDLIGGVKDSTHTKGLAADLQCSDLDRLVDIIEELYPECSIGKYSNFIHFDIRKDHRRW